MYDTYYGFSRPPFGLTPDVRFCFEHRSYTRAKAYMQYAVMREEGFLVVTGRPGMGKTTLIQDLLAELDSEHRLVVRIDSTQLDADDLLRLVTYAFGLPARGLDKATLLHSLGDFLKRRPESAGTAILIVDEAQNLPDRSLEELRLITNLQQGARALIQIFLVGQESLREIIRQRHLEQLQQRVVAACHLEPLDLSETRAYIRHRLLCAGWSGDPIVDGEALRLIHQASGGVPRVINKVCDRLLLYGSVDELHTLTGENAKLVIGEFQGEFLEEPDREESDVGTRGRAMAEPPTIDDLHWEPDGQTPHQAQPARKDEPARYVSTAQPAPAAGSTRDNTRDQADPPTRTSLAHMDLGDEQSTTELKGPPSSQDPPPPNPVSQAEPVAETSQDSDLRSGAPYMQVAGSDNEIPSGAPFSPGTVDGMRRRRPGLRRFSLAAVLLLGVGGLVVALRVGDAHDLAVRIAKLTDGVAARLQSLVSQIGTPFGQAEEDPDSNSLRFDGTPVPTDAEAWAGGAMKDAVEFAETLELKGSASSDDSRPAVAPPFDVGTGSGASAGSPQESDAMGNSGNPEALSRETAKIEWGEAPSNPAPRDATSREPMQPDAPGLSERITAPESTVDGLSPDTGARPREVPLRDKIDVGAEATGFTSEPQAAITDPSRQGESDHEHWREASEAPPPPDHPISASLPIDGNGPQAPLAEAAILSLDKELRSLELGTRGLGDGRLTLDLGEEVPFARGSAQLPAQAERLLDTLAEALARNPDVRITLIGHTDDSGPAEYNRRLSLSRARAVEAYLKRQGVAEQRLSSQGMGKDAPLPNEQEPSAARQRRVEMIIEPIPR